MRFRRLLVACLLATPAVALPATPSNAVTGSVLRMTMTIDCWGCGQSTGTATGTISGIYGNTPLVDATFNAAFNVFAQAVAGGGVPGVCTVNASAAGSFTGAISEQFTLTYVFPGTIIITSVTHGNVWVGYMASTSINCLGQSVFVVVAGGGGISF